MLCENTSPENKMMHWLNKMKYDLQKEIQCTESFIFRLPKQMVCVDSALFPLSSHKSCSKMEAGAIIILLLTIQMKVL